MKVGGSLRLGKKRDGGWVGNCLRDTGFLLVVGRGVHLLGLL